MILVVESYGHEPFELLSRKGCLKFPMPGLQGAAFLLGGCF
jgi:hypothetical protein